MHLMAVGSRGHGGLFWQPTTGPSLPEGNHDKDWPAQLPLLVCHA